MKRSNFLCFIILLIFSGACVSDISAVKYSLTEVDLEKEMVRGAPELFVYSADHSLIYTSKGLIDKYTFNQQLKSALFHKNKSTKNALKEFRARDAKHLERYIAAATNSINNSTRYPEDEKPLILKSSIEFAEASYANYDPSFSALSKKIIGEPDFLKTIKGADYIFVRYFSSTCEPCKIHERQLNKFVQRNSKKKTLMIINVDRTPKM